MNAINDQIKERSGQKESSSSKGSGNQKKSSSSSKKLSSSSSKPVSSSSSAKSGSVESVKIGNQVWMKKNLNVTTASGSWCYGNNPANCDKYGRLYDWATAMNLPSSCNTSSCASQIKAKHRGICPEGWHVPTNAEWKTLTDFVGSPAGKKLKSKSGNGTDDFGFSALPGGNRGGSFSLAELGGYWWSATEYNATDAYNRFMTYGDEGVSSYDF
jgi:uncharacterized protein (TIGR02145 family)